MDTAIVTHLKDGPPWSGLVVPAAGRKTSLGWKREATQRGQAVLAVRKRTPLEWK
jgi:hypothetical protein